jgi:hypothetical protein
MPSLDLQCYFEGHSRDRHQLPDLPVLPVTELRYHYYPSLHGHLTVLITESPPRLDLLDQLWVMLQVQLEKGCKNKLTHICINSLPACTIV